MNKTLMLINFDGNLLEKKKPASNWLISGSSDELNRTFHHSYPCIFMQTGK